MANTQKLSGAFAALMDEYKKALDELIKVIKPINPNYLTKTIEPESLNTDCISIQTILTHVNSSIFSYAIYIENSIGVNMERPVRMQFDDVNQYISRLKEAIAYTENVFIQYPNIRLEEFDAAKKINARWGQQYDVEQMMEHAIVHILRHRRQIEKAIEQFNG
ncbi:MULTISPECIES: DinB family protein [Pedobacter]|uniref:DinB family protein n=1 Tax=Pedobacter TaxID=84567 RepID=UPI001E40E3CD|nr:MULTISPECIES: DinB family protein [Pedobacter]